MQVICLCGRICSGKDYIAALGGQLLPAPTEIFSVSRFVKMILKNEVRTHDSSIDNVLASTIVGELTQLEQEGYKAIILNGIRQLSVLQKVIGTFNEVKVLWIESSDETRAARFANRQDDRDVEDLATYDRKDNELGLEQLEQFIKINYPDNIINN